MKTDFPDMLNTKAEDSALDPKDRPRSHSPVNLERKAKTRAALLSAAKESFSEKGYHHSSVPDIVQRAKLGHGTFYFYFKDREDIFFALAEKLSESMRVYISPLVKGEEDPTRRLDVFIKSYFEAVFRQPDLFKIVYQEGPSIGKKFTNWLKRWNDWTGDRTVLLFEHLALDGALSGNADIRLRANLLANLLPFIALWRLSQSSSDVRETAVVAEELLLQGLPAMLAHQEPVLRDP